MSKLKNDIGQKLLTFREAKKLKRNGVCDELLRRYSLELEPSQLGRYERDEQKPKWDIFLALCELYDITPNDLFMPPATEDSVLMKELCEHLLQYPTQTQERLITAMCAILSALKK